MQVGVKWESVGGHMIICLSDFLWAYLLYALHVAVRVRSNFTSLLCNCNSQECV